MRRRSSEELEKLLISSAREALAIARGEMKPARIYTRTQTARDVNVDAPPVFDAKRVNAMRTQMNVSQVVFAHLLNVSPNLVRSWEQGSRTPQGAAGRLLQLFETHPTLYTKAEEETPLAPAADRRRKPTARLLFNLPEPSERYANVSREVEARRYSGSELVGRGGSHGGRHAGSSPLTQGRAEKSGHASAGLGKRVRQVAKKKR